MNTIEYVIILMLRQPETRFGKDAHFVKIDLLQGKFTYLDASENDIDTIEFSCFQKVKKMCE